MGQICRLVDYEVVRAQLGLAQAELPVQRMAELGLEEEVQLFLWSALPEWESLVDLNWTATEVHPLQVARAKVMLTQLVKFYAAKLLARQLSMIGLSLISDGSNRADRFNGATEGYEEKFDALAYKMLDDLLIALELPPRQVKIYNPLGLAVPIYDPVTGLDRGSE